MLHPLAWRVISNSALRRAKYESVFSLFELNSIALKECLHPFMCRVARFPAPLFKFWLHVSPKLAHRIIVVCHKTLCRYPLMREKCFGGVVPVAQVERLPRANSSLHHTPKHSAVCPGVIRAECWFSVVTVTCYITPPIQSAASKRVAAASHLNVMPNWA